MPGSNFSIYQKKNGCLVLRTFEYEIKHPVLNRVIRYDVEIPLSEYVEPKHLFGNLVAKYKIAIPFTDG